MDSEIKQVRLAPQPNTNIISNQKENFQQTQSTKITNPYISFEPISDKLN